MQIGPDEIKNKVDELTRSRMRKLLLSACQGGYLTDDLVIKTMSSGFWRAFGFKRLVDYLEQELHLPQERACALSLHALRNKHEQLEWYGLAEADIYPAAKKQSGIPSSGCSSDQRNAGHGMRSRFPFGLGSDLGA